MSSTSSHGYAHAMHDLGLAAWFGGSLMGAVGLNKAAAKASNPSERTAIARTGWDAWTPVNAVAIGAHLVGAVILTGANRGRLTAQQGVATTSAAKAAATLGALAITAWGRKVGKEIQAGAPAEGVTEPGGMTPGQVADAQRQEKYLQWAIPALTGTMMVISSKMSEQQKPAEVAKGVLKRLIPAA
jgi:uncharacterized membrane protein